MVSQSCSGFISPRPLYRVICRSFFPSSIRWSIELLPTFQFVSVWTCRLSSVRMDDEWCLILITQGLVQGYKPLKFPAGQQQSARSCAGSDCLLDTLLLFTMFGIR